jgi:ornithine cyclodeaminase/alanine dehydrogenase-like protein (mu-crystallin family)
LSKNILVVGTGTIGEPLIGLLAEHKPALGIDNVYFYKRTPLTEEKGKVEALQRKGAQIVTKKETIPEFKDIGFDAGDVENAYEDAQVIIDCTPSGNKNWDEIYSDLDPEKKIYGTGIRAWFWTIFCMGNK